MTKSEGNGHGIRHLSDDVYHHYRELRTETRKRMEMEVSNDEFVRMLLDSWQFHLEERERNAQDVGTAGPPEYEDTIQNDPAVWE